MAKSIQTSDINWLEETLAEVKPVLAKKQREPGIEAAPERRKRVCNSIISLNEMSCSQ